MCLYGHDLDESVSPIEAGLAWLVGESLIGEKCHERRLRSEVYACRRQGSKSRWRLSRCFQDLEGVERRACQAKSRVRNHRLARSGRMRDPHCRRGFDHRYVPVFKANTPDDVTRSTDRRTVCCRRDHLGYPFSYLGQEHCDGIYQERVPQEGNRCQGQGQEELEGCHGGRYAVRSRQVLQVNSDK